MFDYIATLFACELLELGQLPFKYIARDVSKLGFSFRGILLTEPQAPPPPPPPPPLLFKSHMHGVTYDQAQISENSN